MRYLLKQGYTETGDIAILTPYVGQLLVLREVVGRSSVLRVQVGLITPEVMKYLELIPKEIFEYLSKRCYDENENEHSRDLPPKMFSLATLLPSAAP